MANLLSTSISGTATTSDRVVIGGIFANNAYGSVGSTRLHFGGGDSDADSNYYIGTNKENFGGNYTKLDLRWHTGIRMGARPEYGGIRFFNNETLGSRIMSIGETDANVRIDNNLYIGGAGGWITDLLDAKQNASTAITTGNIGSQSVSVARQLLSPNDATVVAADSAMPSAGHSFIHTLALGPGGNDGHILGMSWAGTTSVYGAQIFLDTDPNDIMAIRSRSSAGVWTSWKTVIHSGTIGSQSVSYATTAGTLTSINISQFTNDSGYLTSASVGNMTRLWAESHPDDYYVRANWTGSYWQLTSNHPSPVQVGYADNAGALSGLGVGSFLRDDGWNSSPGQDANTQEQMRVDFTYSNNAPYTGELIRFGSNGYSTQFNTSYGNSDNFAFRTRNGDNATWNPWRAVIHAGNIGSQSVNYAASAGSAPNGSNLNASYGVTAGAGNGLKFWGGDDTYKISMGNSDEYHYGPVTDYSIKTVIDSVGATRGFTWGVNGGTPIAALNVGNGNMQIAGSFTTTNINAPSGYISNGNPWGTANSAYFPNGITTAGSDNWIYGHTYVGNAPGNGNGHEFWADGNMRSTGHHYLDANYGQTIVGRYSSTVYQGVWAMGDSYKLPMNGSTTGSLYGLAWSHPNAGGVAGNLNTHGLLVMENGTFLAAISGSIRSRDDMRAPYFYGSGSIRVGDMWGGAGLYRPSGSMVFGIEDSDWVFSKGAATQAYFAGGDGNLWMRWAGDWLSNLLGAKQNASTAITTSNIASQSVSNADTVDGFHASVAGTANTIPTRNASGYLIPENWIQLNGIYGLYSPTNNAHLRPNDGSYGSWLVTGSRNGWRGLEFDSGSNGNVSLMVNASSNTTGFHNNSYGWQFYWEGGTLYCSKNAYGAGTNATVLDSVNFTSYAWPLEGSWKPASLSGSTRLRGAISPDGGEFGLAYSSGQIHPYADGFFYQNEGAYRVIDTNSVGSYAPTLTGGGASGSWGISVTGSAGGVAWGNVSSKPAGWLDTTNLIQGREPNSILQSGFYESYLGSGNPTGTWFNYINVRHSNPDNGHGYQIGMSYYDNNLWFRSYQGAIAATFQAWSRALGTNTDPYPSNMNQYVRTTDDVTHNSTTSPLFLVNGHSDNTKGYRIHNTSGTSVSAMFTNSSNQLVIAAGAVDQINLNKKVYVNGVALGVNIAPSATAGRIDASNDIVAYSSSDERLKQNITPIANALDKVKSLTGVEFDWKPEHKEAHGHEGHDTGIIAQQVLGVMPTAVRTNDTGYLAVRYEKLIGLLIEGMKGQQAQIDELKAKLDGLTK